jgi:signal transduction histidine kinase
MVQDEAQRAEYLRTLRAESDRLAGLIGNVLDYARLENGRPIVNRTEVFLQPFLGELQQLFTPPGGAAGKSLVIEDSTLPGSSILTDPGLLRQILGNLLDNAFKHTAGALDGRVWLRVARDSQGQFVFQVEDRGAGIPLIDQRRIFNSFWRGPGRNGCSVPGVGLGLPLARRWSQLLDSTLRVESPIGEQGGSRFVLTLHDH